MPVLVRVPRKIKFANLKLNLLLMASINVINTMNKLIEVDLAIHHKKLPLLLP